MNPNEAILCWGDTGGCVNALYFSTANIALFERPPAPAGEKQGASTAPPAFQSFIPRFFPKLGIHFFFCRLTYTGSVCTSRPTLVLFVMSGVTMTVLYLVK